MSVIILNEILENVKLTNDKIGKMNERISVLELQIKELKEQIRIEMDKKFQEFKQEIRAEMKEEFLKFKEEVRTFNLRMSKDTMEHKAISNYINESREDIIESLDSNNKIYSLDESMGEDTESSILSNVEDKSNNLLDKMNLQLALEKLTKKEQLIIKLRYFEGYSQTEVSERLNSSQVQISRMEAKILEKMKELI